jgi:uncharacterized protein YprB with RNaseH-like and TPR domain
MDIKDRLRALESLTNTRHRGFSAPHPVEQEKISIDAIVEGRTVANEHGSFFYIEQDHQPDYQHGVVRLSDFLVGNPAHLGTIGLNQSFSNTDPRKILFIDTETTGLSGGSGTYVFLVGVGYFVADTFRVAQFFMNDYNEEAALLAGLNALIRQFELIVSYNGKSFDAPLLVSRNIHQSMKSPLLDIPHFDLLHVVRRLWKHRLAECSLGYAESMLTGTYRTGDIPGYLIPQVYFEYLYRGNAKPLLPVLYHNRQDILSMVAILVRAMQLLERPHEMCRNADDIMSVAKLYERSCNWQTAIVLYETFLAGSSDSNQLLLRVGWNYKRLHEWEKAADVWRGYIAKCSFHPLPYIELAKHLEHRQRDYRQAAQLVAKALQELHILESLQRSRQWQEDRADLEKRRERLSQKIKAV